jgi:hypothetical protein
MAKPKYISTKVEYENWPFEFISMCQAMAGLGTKVPDV